MSFQSPIAPTVGRVVLVRCGEAGAKQFGITTEVPALVTRVWSNNCVNLQILRDNATPIAATSVCFDDSDNGPYHLGWRWMPYQKAVAAGEIAATRHAVGEVVASKNAAG